MSVTPTPTMKGHNKFEVKVRVALMVVFAILAATMYHLNQTGFQLGEISEGRSVALFLMMAFAVVALYELAAVAIDVTVRLSGGAPGEVKMLTSFTRVIVVAVIAFILISQAGYLAKISAVLGAFAGLLLGWSLQAPVSGMAAYVLITLKRPFRVGDRVLFPSLGLAGDVLDIGLMYTRLDQVGGAVGSEDAVGRSILIPNAMLFSQVAINYTARQEAAYFIDEVVIRLTYDSDWNEAEEILLAAAREVTRDIIKDTGKQPYVRADNYDYGIYMRLRYMTAAIDRPRISTDILKIVFRDFQSNPKVDFAIPYVYSYRKGMESAGRQSGPEQLTEVDIENIDDTDSPADTRPVDPLYIEQLAERIRQMGLLQPIVVQRANNGRCTLVTGRFRFLACKQLGWQKIPAVVRETEPSRTPGESDFATK